MSRVVFKSDLFVVTEAPETQHLCVAFLGGLGLDLVPASFPLLPAERHLFSDVGYIEGLIEAYNRNPNRFRKKRTLRGP